MGDVMEEKVYSIIRRMTRAELGAVILGAGYALPADKSSAALQDCVRSLLQSGDIDQEDFFVESAEYNHA